jgi:endonuclease/exonuclease/phosphatase family metal-dependent hydrolase
MIINVMSFNIRGTRDSRFDGLNAWENRRNLNIATIQNYAPDVLGFQEAQQGNIEAYATSLSDYSSFHGLAASRQEGSEYTPIYWKTSRFELVESGQFYLSASPDKETLGWESSLIRVAAWLKLRELASNETFFVLNTHFPHEEDLHETRNHCAKLIIEQVKRLAGDLPMIVMGDFNATPDSAAYHSFLEAGFSDSYADSSPVRANTFHNFEGEKYSVVGRHIDWILTQGFSTVASQVIRDAEPPFFPSDHYPVLASLATEAEGE